MPETRRGELEVRRQGVRRGKQNSNDLKSDADKSRGATIGVMQR